MKKVAAAKTAVTKTAVKKAAAGKRAAKPPAKRAELPDLPRGLPELYYRAHTLLTTVRSIAQHEDRLCILLHEMKRQGTMRVGLAKELRLLVEEMPAEEYAMELRALEEELGATVAA